MCGVFDSPGCVLSVINAPPGIKEVQMQSHLINFDSRLTINGYVSAFSLF